MTIKVPKRYERIIDAACEADREWFLEHPDADRYTREAMPGEFYPKEWDVREAFGKDFVVDVVQLRPGVRGRMPRSRA